jgi:imidazolonepropionase-like amidohydrolase
LRIEDRVGSITVGKDADIVIAKGCPMLMTVKPEVVFINGEMLS